MLPLSRPEYDDAQYLATLCSLRNWLCHAPAWQGAYTSYEAIAGDPWNMTPAIFDPDIADAQRALYDTRKSYGFIKEIRRRKPLKCCPMCGSLHAGHVDHYLPRCDFPEFSVFSLNLVPACQHCNSDVKGDTYKGTTVSERFLHPYFDTLAAQPIWRVEFQPPYQAVRFKAVPLPTLSAQDAARVTFHLKNTLGPEFDRFMATDWSTAAEVLEAQPKSMIPLETLIARAAEQLQLNEKTRGVNSWTSAFWRGLLADPAVLLHLPPPPA